MICLTQCQIILEQLNTGTTKKYYGFLKVELNFIYLQEHKNTWI